MATNPTAIALQNAKKALDNANKFTRNVTGGKPNAFAPAAPAKTNYSHAREARTATLGDEAESAAKGLKSRQENVDQYLKPTQ